MRRTLMLAGGLALAVALAAPAGAGQTERVDTKVTLKDACRNSGGPVNCRMASRQRNYTARFYGRVRSDVPACERRRTVKLIRTFTKVPRPRGTKLEATTKSDSDGKWEIVTDKPPWGTYVAKATRKRRGDIVCKPDKSKPEQHELEI